MDEDNAVRALDGNGFVKTIKIPKAVGYWVLYPEGEIKTKYAMFSKPTEEQIQNTEKLLGWGWEDA